MKKTVLKGIIKECIREMILEEKFLSNIVSETITGVLQTQNLISEIHSNPQKQNFNNHQNKLLGHMAKQRQQEQQQTLTELNQSAFNNVNFSENIRKESSTIVPGTDIKEPSFKERTGLDEHDPGIPLEFISQLVGGKFKI